MEKIYLKKITLQGKIKSNKAQSSNRMTKINEQITDKIGSTKAHILTTNSKNVNSDLNLEPNMYH